MLPMLIEESSFAPQRRQYEILINNVVKPLAILDGLLKDPELIGDSEYLLQKSNCKDDENNFRVNFDVRHFKPEEITVKTTGGNSITVEAKHEERNDLHGQIYRHFVRTYKIPKDYDMNKLESRLSTDGVLSVTAPPKVGEQIQHKRIPITQTGKPSTASKPLDKPSRSLEGDKPENPRKKKKVHL